MDQAEILYARVFLPVENDVLVRKYTKSHFRGENIENSLKIRVITLLKCNKVFFGLGIEFHMYFFDVDRMTISRGSQQCGQF